MGVVSRSRFYPFPIPTPVPVPSRFYPGPGIFKYCLSVKLNIVNRYQKEGHLLLCLVAWRAGSHTGSPKQAGVLFPGEFGLEAGLIRWISYLSCCSGLGIIAASSAGWAHHSTNSPLPYNMSRRSQRNHPYPPSTSSGRGRKGRGGRQRGSAPTTSSVSQPVQQTFSAQQSLPGGATSGSLHVPVTSLSLEELLSAISTRVRQELDHDHDSSVQHQPPVSNPGPLGSTSGMTGRIHLLVVATYYQ